MPSSNGASGEPLGDVLGAIDPEAAPYFLGWIATGGSVGEGRARIDVPSGDRRLAARIGAALAKGLPPGAVVRRAESIRLRSEALAREIARILDVELSAKPRRVEREACFPSDLSGEGAWAFLRGCFDARGILRAPSVRRQEPRCRLPVRSERLRRGLLSFSSIQPARRGCFLEWSGNNALDLMAKLYEDASLARRRHRRLYRAWAGFVPPLSDGGGRRPRFRWSRTCPDAVAPFKDRASDSGYDLTLIRKAKTWGAVTLYGTGLRIEPGYGWYFDLVPRSSIIKTGHLLANGVGVIDRTYRGEILVPLVKVDPDAPELALPARIVQIIPRPIVHGRIEAADALDETARGDSGFGSTG